MGDDVIGYLAILSRLVRTAMLREDDISHDATDTVIDAEAGFVPRIEGEEDAIVGEGDDAFGEEGSDD